MNTKLDSIVRYIHKNQKKVIVNTILVVVLLLLVAAPILYYLQLKTQYYTPTKACDLLTPAKATDALGDKVINVEKNTPVISDDDNLATSKCGFTDTNIDTSKMKIVAVAVQSAITDEGIVLIQANFQKAKAIDGMKDVENLGQDAYFNPENGQLNILEKRRWIIVSYGLANSPASSTLKDVQGFAEGIL